MAENATQPWQGRKISRMEWADIVNRHRHGETFASIARAYNCTPPAIRYIVRRELQRLGSEGGENPSSGPSTSSGGVEPVPPLVDRFSPSRVAIATDLSADLRDLTTGEIASFLVSFDRALEKATVDSLASLRGATDRLLRAVARVRIALEPIADVSPRDIG